MDWYELVFELIDMRSFSNLWFWIALAVLWSTVSHWVLGVPWDMVIRAQKKDGAPMQDVEALVRINSGRILYIAEESGLLIAGFAGFVLSVLVLTGFYYGREFAQAVFLLGAPMGVVWLVAVRTAKQIRASGISGDMLIKKLTMLRFYTRFIGMVSILITVMWGMSQNLSSSALGG